MGVLRLFLALSVVFHHIPQSPFHWLHGSVAVIGFFMVSGFYMTLVINEKYRMAEGPWITRFYLSRAFRIFPVYLAVVLAVVLWYFVSHTPSVFTANMGHGFWGQLSLVWMNLFIFGQDWHQLTAFSLAEHDVNGYTAFMAGHFGTAYFGNSMMLIGQAWTLAIELLFYLLAPFVVHSRRRIVVLFLASLLVRAAFRPLADTFNPLAWGYYFFPSVLCFFLMGSLAYYLYRHVNQRAWANKAALPVNLLLLSGVLYVMAVKGYPIIEKATGYDTVALWLRYGAFALCLPFVFLLWKNNRVDRWLGDFSYPVYIVHGLVIGLVLGKTGLAQGSYAAQITILTVSLLVAGFACVAIEVPFDRWRQRRFVAQVSSRQPLHPATPLKWVGAMTLAVCIYIGWLTMYSPLQAPPARLVKVEQVLRYNIVNYNDRFYGIAFGIPIEWGGPNYEATPGLIIAKTQEEVSDAIHKQAGSAPQ
ncbi:acyltransferase [Pseudomonas sp. GV071]|uniref:acyltransferase family protein n=1 Tax=Pseudomonas sp. GV071 TaxID=2135754 RepID=UPI000D3BFF1B|nr:acyltransferase [Pseudomonas sp. GV071]PTQ67909.1 peptidoglycan/LPS O-acetylase OafA/YrhL [Pseudomonas sp. GV071]